MTEPENSNDMQLVERCRLGDERAFEQLYARYRLPLFSYLHKLLQGEPSMVDDIFQQVWIKANRNWDKYSDQQKLQKYCDGLIPETDYYSSNETVSRHNGTTVHYSGGYRKTDFQPCSSKLLPAGIRTAKNLINQLIFPCKVCADIV